ncbi:MAG: hypothetical protein H7X97_11900, partial [Opitutaceae bacterium]|nr:hypothetical protein [Verrucomicrobiales bacterium]
TATGNTFGHHAKLVVVTPLGGGDSVVQVRDGSGKVDVSPFFLHEQVSAAVSGSISNLVTRKTILQEFSIHRLALRNAEGFPALGLHFDVRGFASDRIASNGVSTLEMEGSGAGDAGGHLLILQGFIEVRGDRLEVVEGGAET